jgi:hypothetical protein
MKRMSCVGFVVAVCVLTVCAQGSVYTWTAGGGTGATNWATASNWGGTGPGSGDTAVFSI